MGFSVVKGLRELVQVQELKNQWGALTTGAEFLELGHRFFCVQMVSGAEGRNLIIRKGSRNFTCRGLIEDIGEKPLARWEEGQGWDSINESCAKLI